MLRATGDHLDRLRYRTQRQLVQLVTEGPDGDVDVDGLETGPWLSLRLIPCQAAGCRWGCMPSGWGDRDTGERCG